MYSDSALSNPPILNAIVQALLSARAELMVDRSPPVPGQPLTLHKGRADFSPKERLSLGLFGYVRPWEKQHTGALFI